MHQLDFAQTVPLNLQTERRQVEVRQVFGSAITRARTQFVGNKAIGLSLFTFFGVTQNSIVEVQTRGVQGGWGVICLGACVLICLLR